MGYYTYFTMDIIPSIPDDFPEQFEKVTDYSFNNIGSDSIKWYDWEENMTLLSSMYPNYIFHLRGDGEDSEDRWHAAFINGQSRHRQAETIYPSLDVETLDNIKQRCPELFL